MNDDDIALLRQILSGRSIPSFLETTCETKEVYALFTELSTIRNILTKFANGNFEGDITIRGAIAGCLKTLQAHFNHLTWQVQQVAVGDFSQRVEFMGDFSQAFNSMVAQLDQSVTDLKDSEKRLLQLANDLQKEISFRNRAEKGLRQSEERWNLAVQCSRDGIWDMNLDSKEAWYSERFIEMFQYSPDEFPKDLRWDLFIHPEDETAVETLRKIYTLEEVPPYFEIECRMRCKDTSYLWVRIRGMKVKDVAEEGNRIIGVTSDISLQKETENLLAHRAMYDKLTGLPNRYLLDDRLRQHIANASRTGDSFILVTLDLDNFKYVNDTWGHAAGDTLLVELGKRLCACMRNTDTVARLGGDEFVFIYTCGNGNEQFATEQVMTRLYTSFKEAISLGDTMYNISSSMGVSFFPKHAEDIPTLFEKADEALYRVKEHGKNAYAIWE